MSTFESSMNWAFPTRMVSSCILDPYSAAQDEFADRVGRDSDTEGLDLLSAGHSQPMADRIGLPDMQTDEGHLYPKAALVE
jgi:hypothetical protein